ncbi:MAG: argininosuccinate lyase [Propionibacteriaceae bacterium]|nr:argininosuccinate lyase [Propionibacteriaceae bacterium]
MSDKLWGGRFASDVTSDVLQYTETVSVDGRMLGHDLWQDVVHVMMLRESGINTCEDTCTLLSGLLTLEGKRLEGQLLLKTEDEDVHLNIEHLMTGIMGDVAGRMHTARSRNDQVQTDARMVSREWILDAVHELSLFAKDLATSPLAELTTVIPGYTHSQAAQPMSVAFWKAAHANALLRDASRLANAWERVNVSPLGACALAGTSFAIDRVGTASLLGFIAPIDNALDATSTRDWTVEVAAAAASGATNISRMQEEIVVWSSNEFRLVEVHDSFATGSSIMPQKKNPVVAELARGKTGRVVGTLVQLLIMEKSVALGYSCDLQEDKPLYWMALDTYLETIRLCRQQNQGLTFNATRGLDLCWRNLSTATELANLLVSTHGIPFRTAHRIIGDLVSGLVAADKTLKDSLLVTQRLTEHGISTSPAEVRQTCDPEQALRRYRSTGSTAPNQVTLQRDEIVRTADRNLAWCEKNQQMLSTTRDAAFTKARTQLQEASA